MVCAGRRAGIPLLTGFTMTLALTAGFGVATAATEVMGDYRYAYHAPETADQAKTHACREASRAAVGRSEAFREATAPFVDSPFMRELLDATVRDALKDVQIVEQVEKGATVSCTVKGQLDQQDVSQVVLRQMRGRPELTQPGLDQNRAVKLLRTNEDKDGNVIVIFQALRRLDWQSTHYQGSLREQADIMVEFYDEQGQLLSQARYPARKTIAGDDVMHPGEIGTRKIAKPAGTRSFRVWVPK